MMIKETIFLLIPLLIPLLVPALSLVNKRFGKYISIVFYAAGAVLGILLFPQITAQSATLNMGGWAGSFAINLVLNPLSLSAGILIYVVSLFIQSSTWKEEKPASYSLLINLFIFACLGMLMTTDLFNLFVMMELASISSLSLIAISKKASASKSSFLYMVMSSLTALLMLAGIALLYSATGNLNMAVLASMPALAPAFAILVAILLLGVILLHAEILPFANWAPPVYDDAPTSFTATLAGVGALAGGVVLINVFSTLFSAPLFENSIMTIKNILFILAVVSVLFGEIAALKEKSLKKLLAYSSIGQMGLLVVALSMGHEVALQSALLILLSHTIVKPIMLLIAGHFMTVTGSPNWEDMNGVGRTHPILAVIFIIGSLTLMGIPLFLGFWGKFGLLIKLFENVGSGIPVLTIAAIVILLFAFIIEGTYLMKISHSFFEKGEQPVKKVVNLPLTLSGLIVSSTVLLLGVWPSLITNRIQAMSLELININQFIQNILSGGAL